MDPQEFRRISLQPQQRLGRREPGQNHEDEHELRPHMLDKGDFSGGGKGEGVLYDEMGDDLADRVGNLGPDGEADGGDAREPIVQ